MFDPTAPSYVRSHTYRQYSIVGRRKLQQDPSANRVAPCYGISKQISILTPGLDRRTSDCGISSLRRLCHQLISMSSRSLYNGKQLMIDRALLSTVAFQGQQHCYNIPGPATHITQHTIDTFLVTTLNQFLTSSLTRVLWRYEFRVSVSRGLIPHLSTSASHNYRSL